MARLLFHEHAERDLQDLALANLRLAARLIALLDEIRSDRNWMDMLTVHGFGADERELFNVSRWQEYWNQDKDLWRLKFWELEHQGLQYRVVYALKRGTGDHHVLAIARRDFDYDPEHPTTRRILQAYDEL